MADTEQIKISQLPEKLDDIQDTDLIPFVDGSSPALTTRKMKYGNAKKTLEGTKYPWKGQWTTATSYSANDCVQENGSGYVCVTANISGTFATDLANGDWQLLVAQGTTGAIGPTGPQGATGANVNLLYGTSNTPPGGTTPDGTLYVTYIP